MMMGIIPVPCYLMYWQQHTRISCIADVMPINKYKEIRRFLHAVDNSEKSLSGNKDDKLFKIRPVLETVRSNCLKVIPEENQSIDEQILPTKTKTSGIRQYNPKKPHKWGFKALVRSGISGFMYDFFLYTGAKSIGEENCTAQNVVLKLVAELPTKKNFKVCFDNCSSLPNC